MCGQDTAGARIEPCWLAYMACDTKQQQRKSKGCKSGGMATQPTQSIDGSKRGGGSSGGQKFRVEQGSRRLDEHQKVEVGSKWEWDWYQMGM